MIVIQDFTKLSEGITVPSEGRVSRCPKCGRNGIERRPGPVEPLVTFLHVQASRLFGDGMLTEPADCCSVAATALQRLETSEEH
ncbi:MAG: hypothetical protein ABR576_06840 [Thermoanaerobaculia bacterium]